MGLHQTGIYSLSGSSPHLPTRQAYAWARVFESALVVLILFLFMRALVAVIFFPHNLPPVLRMEYVDPRLRMMTATAYLLMLALVVVFHRDFLRAIRHDPWLMIFLAWIFLSLLWSTNRGVTLRRFVPLSAATACGVYLGARFRLEEQLRLVLILLGIIALLSLFLGLLRPDLSRYMEPRGEVWSGVFVQKNGLGRSMALTILLTLYGGRFIPRSWRWALLFLATPLLVLSQSRTAQTSTVVMLLMLPYLKTLRRASTPVRAFLISTSLLLIAYLGYEIFRHWKDLLLWMGRDPSLTGRTLIWALVWQAIQKRFWLGYGFEAFWSGHGGAMVNVWRHFSGMWIPMHAHNGVLELWLHAGIVGVVLWLGLYVRDLILALRLPHHLWPLGFLVLLGVYSIAEPTVVVPDGAPVLFWILFVSLSLRLRIEGTEGLSR